MPACQGHRCGDSQSGWSEGRNPLPRSNQASIWQHRGGTQHSARLPKQCKPRHQGPLFTCQTEPQFPWSVFIHSPCNLTGGLIYLCRLQWLQNTSSRPFMFGLSPDDRRSFRCDKTRLISRVRKQGEFCISANSASSDSLARKERERENRFIPNQGQIRAFCANMPFFPVINHKKHA